MVNCVCVHPKWSKFVHEGLSSEYRLSLKELNGRVGAYVLSSKASKITIKIPHTECAMLLSDVIVRDFPHLPVYRDSCFDCLFMNHIGIVKTFHH